MGCCLKTGEIVTFYHEGGSGENYWSNGWRCGRLVKPEKPRANWCRIEIELSLRHFKERPRYWVHLGNVNPLGDFVYHGAGYNPVAELKARKAAKAVQQEKADQAKKPRSRSAKHRTRSTQPKK
jgi:hypothetical protein